MIGYWQDQTGSIDAGFFQFTIQTHFAIATFRRHPRDLPALFPGIFFIPGRTYLDKEFPMIALLSSSDPLRSSISFVKTFSIDTSLLQFWIQTHFAIATFRCLTPRAVLPALVLD